MRRRWGEDGQASVLVFGMLLVLLAVGGLVFDGSRAFLSRRQLQNALDSAVLGGAENVNVDRWKASSGAIIELDPDAASAAAARIFRLNAPVGASASFETRGSVIEGRARRRVEFFLLSLVGVGGYDIEVRASASPAFTAGG